MKYLAVLGLLISVSSFGMIVPENNEKIYVGDKNSNSMTEQEFHQVIDSVEEVYTPIVAQLGGKLYIERKWEDPTVNAYAIRIGTGGRTWKVAMFGGLARHHTITKDAFAAVVCHEIGHHMGGMPRYAQNANHMSTEGQADYFAMNKCLKRTWASDNVKIKNAPEFVKQSCKTHSTEKAYQICLRSALAGQSLANLFAALRKVPVPKFHTRNETVVEKVYEKHPESQCRLDTYFQASLCTADLDTPASQSNVADGNCFNNAGLSYHQEDRPLCWFHDSGFHSAKKSIIEKNNNELARLIDLGIDVDAKDKSGVNLLQHSITQENPFALDILLGSGANPDITDHRKLTLAHLAANTHTPELVKVLKDYNQPLGKLEKEGFQPIHWAAKNENIDMVEMFTRSGVSINARSMFKETPLTYALLNSNYQFINELLSLKPNLNTRTVRKITPLIRSIRKSRTDITKLLLEEGADVNLSGYGENTPLHFSATKNNVELVKLLLKHGANKKAKNSQGETPYKRAKSRNASKEIRKLLR